MGGNFLYSHSLDAVTLFIHEYRVLLRHYSGYLHLNLESESCNEPASQPARSFDSG